MQLAISSYYEDVSSLDVRNPHYSSVKNVQIHAEEFNII